MDDDKVMGLPLIYFNHYENIGSFLFHKKLLPDNGKKITLCTNMEHYGKGKVITWKSIVVKIYEEF